MKKAIMSKRNWRILGFYIIGWTLAFLMFVSVRTMGTIEVGLLEISPESRILMALCMGVVMGLISGIAQVLTEERLYKNYSLRNLLFIRFCYSLLFIITLTFLAFFLFTTLFNIDMSITDFTSQSGSIAVYVYVLSVDFLLSVLRQVNLLLGEGNLNKLLRGKFYTPREEERIFMFLDLQASTTLAEKLGHIKYSTLIQDCFNDLAIVNDFGAEIYQYVGDEAVLTWPLEKGLKNQNCLEAYFNFVELLKKRSGYYKEKYHCEPFFKAGLHSGLVTVTEVGKYKKEIAYHGDTINTAARIQGQCNKLEASLLISEALKNQLSTGRLTYVEKGSIPLKGKLKEVTIFSVLKS